MSKGFSFLGGVQNRRTQCLVMAIHHAGAAGGHYDAEDVIANAAAFDDYIQTGEVPEMDEHPTTGDDAPVTGVEAGLGTLDPEPPLAKAADENELKSAATDQGNGAPSSVSETENEKRVIEQKLAVAQQLGLRLLNVQVIDAEPFAEWHFKGRDSLFLRLIVKTAAEDISSKIGKVFDAGFIIRAVHYDDAGFPCVSWSPVSAAA